MLNLAALEINGYELRSLAPTQPAWEQALALFRNAVYLDYSTPERSLAQRKDNLDGLISNEFGPLLTLRMSSMYKNSEMRGWFSGERLWGFAVFQARPNFHYDCRFLYVGELTLDPAAPAELVENLAAIFQQCALDNECAAMMVTAKHHSSRVREILEVDGAQIPEAHLLKFLPLDSETSNF